ncbi:unnamed protein product, partial [Nesidiocoris tenuis]
MSSLTRTRVLEAQGEDFENALKKRKGSPSRGLAKKQKIDENMAEPAKQKRANFSALSSNANGVHRNSSLVNLKPGAAKKLVVKNLQ